MSTPSTPEIKIPVDFIKWASAVAVEIALENEAQYDAAIGMAIAAYRHLYSQPDKGLKQWVKCSERMPLLPDPLPADTPDERPVLFFNLRHSSTWVWFPSYGFKAEDQFPLEADIDRRVYDEGFGREYWEWLEEIPAPSPLAVSENFPPPTPK